ncbi:MAG TPA: ABC transporter substrate-binding protein, partial [Holophaga sp.]|nr:ABC transporter substrate-binding protein [Holophaga sp.]HPS66845.1 ABC transporter substrate-binding protein [Holophaga sp.]
SILVAGVALSAGAQTVKIGWFGPETGDSALFGQAEKNTVLMLAEEFNAKGGVDVGGKKYKIEIVPYDDKGDSVEAVNVVKRLISQDKVIAIVGAQGSGEAIPVAPLVNGAKVPLVSSTATNPKVTVGESGVISPFMFRACFIDPYQGKAAAYYCYQKLGKRKAAVLMTIDDPYSTGLAEFYKQNFEKAGGKVVAEVSYTSGEKDFRAPLTKIKAAKPDVVFIPAYYNDVALVAKQARELGLNQLLFGGDGWPSENLIPLAGKALEGCMFINHLDMEGNAAKPMRTAYKAKFNRNAELNSYMVRDALYMVIDAMQRAKSVDPAAIQKALLTCDIQGITGHIKIGPQHDPIGKEAWIIKIVGKGMKFQEKFVASN